MRILHTADWHLGKTLEGRSRFQEHEAFFDELEQIVRDEKIDVLLMAGDVFDTVNPPAAAEQLFYENISLLTEKYKLPMIIIAGNHDHPDRLTAAKRMAKNQGVRLLGYPGIQPQTIPVKDEILELAALPYPSESRLKGWFHEVPEETSLRDAYNKKIKYLFTEMTKNFSKDAVSVAMSHLFVAGGSTSDSERPIEVGGAYTIHPDTLPSVQYTALGHLHRPQEINGNHRIRYSGSPLAFSFSEAGYTKSVTIVDVAPHEEPNVTEIPLSCGRPLVRWIAKEGLNQVKKWLAEGKDDNAWVDIEVHVEDTPSIEDIHMIRQAHEGIVHIRPVFIGEEEDNSEEIKRAHMPIDQLFQKFYEIQTGGAKADESLVRLFMDIVDKEGHVGASDRINHERPS